MSEPIAAPERRVRLSFRAQGELERADQAVRSDLSTVTAHGRCLWVANDELATRERLTRRGDASYAGHEAVHLGANFDLPEGADGPDSELLVVYDLPAEGRLHQGTGIEADVFRLERRGARPRGTRAGH